jgi:hypothetical protein
MSEYFASAVAEASSYTKSGQLVTASASASASSTLSYEDAYQIALNNAKNIAQQNAEHDANIIMSNECCLETYTASADATSSDTANNGQVVTSSATATASSTLNYEDAYAVAHDNAKKVAKSVAENNTNIINQSFPGVITLENLKSSNNVYNIHDNSNYYYIKGSKGNSNSMPPVFSSFIQFNEVSVSAIDSKGNIYIGGNFKGYNRLLNLNIFTFLKTKSTSNTIFNYVAMWNGDEWLPLGSGLGDTVKAIAIDLDDNVYFGGSFTALGNNTLANYVAKWTPRTSSWSVLGPSATCGVNDEVNALAIDSDNNLYVGGKFTKLGDNTTLANNIAKWTPSTTSGTWSVLGTSSINGVLWLRGNSEVNALAVDSSKNVYVGGIFTTLSNVITTNSTNTAVTNSNVVTFGTVSSVTLTVGMFVFINGQNIPNLYIISIQTQTFIALSSSVNISAGTLISFSGTVVNNIAKWTPSTSTWSVLGTGSINGVLGADVSINALAVDSSNNVYVGGIFTTLSNVTATNSTNIAVSSSNSLTFGTASTATLTSNMYVFINGQTNSNLKINNVINQTYIILSNNVTINANTLISFSGTVTNNIAKWTPSTTSGTWSVLGTSAINGVLGGNVKALAIDSSNNVYVGGSFTTLGDRTTLVGKIAKWNPIKSVWSTVGETSLDCINGIPSDVETIIINKSNNTIYVNDQKLYTDYINLYYNKVLMYTLYQDGSICNIYANNKNGKKLSLIPINTQYQNYF